jgi:hypothetical protein
MRRVNMEKFKQIMKKIGLILLNIAIKFIVGKDVFVRVQNVVEKVADMDVPGEKKREIVLDELKDIANDGKKYLINLAIETAVAKLKELSK